MKGDKESRTFSIRIDDITAGDVIDFRGRVYARLAGYPNTANKVYNTFKVVLSEAKLRMDIPVNPAAGIGPPKSGQSREIPLAASVLENLPEKSGERSSSARRQWRSCRTGPTLSGMQ